LDRRHLGVVPPAADGRPVARERLADVLAVLQQPQQSLMLDEDGVVLDRRAVPTLARDAVAFRAHALPLLTAEHEGVAYGREEAPIVRVALDEDAGHHLRVVDAAQLAALPPVPP